MPPAPSWYTRIPAAIATLRQMTTPWPVSRTSLETMLGIGARRAQQLMSTMPTHTAGNVAFVEREDLIRWMENTLAGDKAEYEHGRRQRVGAALQALHEEQEGRKHEIYTAEKLPAIRVMGLAELPATVMLRPGELQIQFIDMKDLMQQLFQFSQAAMNDYVTIERLLRP